MRKKATPEEMEYVINDSDAVVVFCDPSYRETIESLDLPAVREIIDHDRAEELIASHPAEEIEGLEGITGGSMIYTSGTTGKPKGAVRTQTDPALVARMVAELRLQPDDVHITTGPLYHSGPAAFSALTHVLGGTIVILERFDPLGWLELVDGHQVTSTFTAPTQLKRIVNVDEDVRKRHKTESLRVVIANAAPVPFALKKQWIETFGEGHLFEVYGSTELGVDTIIAPEDQLRKPGSCGKPYGGIEIRLITEDGKDAPVGDPGVMWIRSPAAFDGYHKAPEKTEGTKLADDPSWRTVGDIAYRDDEGFYYICDRSSDMIISATSRISGRAVQTDANISPACYGGPLLDIQGRVIGICVPLHPESAEASSGAEWYDSGMLSAAKGELAPVGVAPEPRPDR
jgi:acyl-coenzyme A synthetase/AMP-(fatty) acid ligase